jgi:hypothetical protein
MTETPGQRTDDESAGLSPEDSLALIGAQRRATRRALAIDDWLLYGTWGIAWLVAYSVTYFVFPHVSDESADIGPVWLVVLVWPVAMGAAAVVTFRHVHSRRAGITGGGRSMFGLAYLLGTGAAGLTGSALPRMMEPVDPGLAALGPSVCIVLVIGMIYLVSGAFWGDRLQVGVGVWLLAINVIALLTGPDTYTLTMAIGGGGGFLVGALLAWRRDRAIEAAAPR